MSGTGSESTKMRTRSQSRPDAIEDDTSSVITNVSDSSFTDDADDNSIEGDPEVCFACDKIIEGLIIHKGGTWCVECINIEKNKDDALEQRMQRSNRYPIWILVSLCILIPAVVGGYYADLEIMPFSPSKDVIKNHTTCADLKAEIKRLKSDFASQESDTWYNFYSGIENVLPGPNAVGSTTFLLLHEARARQTADRIARQVGRLAAGCLGGNLLHLEGTTIAADPSKHELFLQTYQKKVEESRVLYVSEFERLPSGVAKEFHFFCDSYTPLVPHSVFVLLLQVESLPTGDDVTAAAESQLKRIWGRDLPTNIIQPLITRITANVVRIYE